MPPVGNLSGIAAAVAQLPAEIRMGTDAGARFRDYVAGGAAPATLGRPGDDLGGLPWAMATPLVIDETYPANLWVMVASDGRAISAGILSPTPPTYPGGHR